MNLHRRAAQPAGPQTGLHTANIGKLLPGETVELELRTAQLLSFDHGRLRLAISNTIAPRCGRPGQAGLLPHQAPLAALATDYPLSLSVVVAGSLANATIDCPTHAVHVTPTSGGITVALAPGAQLDRDVVFTVTPQAPSPNLLVCAQDEVGAHEGAGTVMLAAFETPSAAPRACATLKLLADCSGLMAGDSMASARRALHDVVGEPRRGDTVSFSRFGTTLERVAASAAPTARSTRAASSTRATPATRALMPTAAPTAAPTSCSSPMARSGTPTRCWPPRAGQGTGSSPSAWAAPRPRMC
jgi:hypothetical protein